MKKEHAPAGQSVMDEGECRVISVPDGPFGKEVFIVCHQQQHYAYENSCPHTGGPLDWTPGKFLDLEKTHIQCSTHHALFRIDDGYCISGPCAGQSLKKVTVTESNGELELDV